MNRMNRKPVTQADYVAQGGGHCPVCRSGDITGGPVQIDGPTAWQDCTCGECGTEWTDTYNLVQYDLKEP